MIDQSDEVIRERLLTRFSRVFEHGPPKTITADIADKRGQSKTEEGGKGWWHPLAIAYEAKRVSEGAKTNQACREFQKILAKRHSWNVVDGTVMDVVRSNRGRNFREDTEQQFCIAVIDNDIDRAVSYYKLLTPKQRARWDLD